LREQAERQCQIVWLFANPMNLIRVMPAEGNGADLSVWH
jgi:hypothetical protein